MKKVIILLSIIMFFFKTSVSANYEKKIYDFSIESITGEIINFKDYKNKAILIVNTASYCGFTKQYDELQELWDLFKIECIKRKFSFQKLSERAIDLYMKDEDFRRKVTNHSV